MKTLKLLIAAVLIAIAIPSRADYLIVSRAAKIKVSPTSSSGVAGTAKAGDTLFLVTNTQQNGYYNVQVPNSAVEGWIYRTLVRRYTDGTAPVPQPSSGDLKIRVLDVGAGLCVVMSLPDHKYLIFDAGDNKWNLHATLPAIEKIIPKGSPIEQIILSHNDGDHIYAVTDIINAYKVKKIVYTGYSSDCLPNPKDPSGTYTNMVSVFKNPPYHIDVVNLHDPLTSLTPGTINTYDDVRLVFLCGFGEPMKDWDLKDDAEHLNSVSIVAKVVYKNVSVLLTGDAVGRHREDKDPEEIIATEKYLVENAGDLLRSDIIVAPHHGGNNASSTAFINKVAPQYVIFSAGHDNQHPTQAAAERYLRTVKPENIFRTDLGDDESPYSGCCPEWIYGRIPGCKDPIGDDDVEIVISGNGKYTVNYLSKNSDGGK
jgi:beta-lactamase superfamily II metal-dependent hydrolase